jgi:hypothetical protein
MTDPIRPGDPPRTAEGDRVSSRPVLRAPTPRIYDGPPRLHGPPSLEKLEKKIEDLEKKLLSFAAMNLVLASLLKERRFLDGEEFLTVVAAATKIHDKGGPSTFEELLSWANKR